MKAVSGSSHANFPTLLSEEFPTAPKITGSEADFSVDMLASKLARVVHAQSIDAVRFVLCGVCFEFEIEPAELGCNRRQAAGFNLIRLQIWRRLATSCQRKSFGCSYLP
jgi:DNA polymerase III sliding clamp (beta) subunit (PCNA family)